MYKKKYQHTYRYSIVGLLSISYLFIYALCIKTLYILHKKEQKTAFYKTEIEKHNTELLLMQNNDLIKKYAQETLHMKQLNLKDIHTMRISI